MSATVGFVVIYRWRLHPGKEQQFQREWEINTPLFIHQSDALGSRLHRSEDGTWLAYAQWPDKATWEKSTPLSVRDPDGFNAFMDAIAESYPRQYLTPVSDFLIHSQIK